MKHFAITLLIVGIALLTGCRPLDVPRELQNACKFAEEQKWDEAIAIADKCLAAVPGNVDATALKSLCLFKAKLGNAESVDHALELISQAVALAPDRYDIQFIHGWELLMAKRPKEAMAPLRKAYDLHLRKENAAHVPQKVQGAIKFYLGECCYRNNLYAEAARYQEQALSSSPFDQWPSLYNNIAVFSRNAGRIYEATGFVAKAQKMAPQDWTIALNMAVLNDYMSDKRYNPASADAYRATVPGWYNYSRSLLHRQYAGTKNVQALRFAQTLDAEITRRLQEISTGKH
ncbi:MAG: tetratricopeptide repeat protein [Victivallales bacterium]|nr:tetratricopeptide repeat protein [Victivallales bacterium]